MIDDMDGFTDNPFIQDVDVTDESTVDKTMYHFQARLSQEMPLGEVIEWLEMGAELKYNTKSGKVKQIVLVEINESETPS